MGANIYAPVREELQTKHHPYTIHPCQQEINQTPHPHLSDGRVGSSGFGSQSWRSTEKSEAVSSTLGLLVSLAAPGIFSLDLMKPQRGSNVLRMFEGFL